MLLLAGAPSAPQSAEETLIPGPARERPIAGGEAHAWRVEVADAPLLLTVKQLGLDLVVEGQAEGTVSPVDTGDHAFGAEVLLLESPGEHRIEVRPKDRFVAPGRYTIELEPVTDAQHRAALSLMTRAGQEVVAGALEARRRAVALYREALAAWRTLGKRRWEAETVYAIAVLERDMRDLKPAIEGFLQALALWRELGELHLEAATLNGLGLTHAYRGESEAAREALQKALSQWQRMGDRFEIGETRGNFCYLDLTSGALSAALPCLEEVRAIYHELGSRRQEARTLNNLGGAYDGLGRPDDALRHYEQALDLRRSLGDRRGEAETLNNIAVVHRALGEWQEALRIYGQMREILAPLGDRALEAARLNNVGFAYTNLGEPQRALSFLEDSLKLRQEAGDHGGQVQSLNNLGDAWRRLGDADKGLAYHQRALELAKPLSDRRPEALTRLRLGEVQIERNDSSAALRELDLALGALREAGLRHREAQALQLRGRALALAGQPREALPVFQELLARRRALRDRAGEAETLQALAATERSLGLLEDARAHAEEAVTRVEELRTGFVSPALRAAFLATQRRAYSLVIDLHMDRHAAAPQAGHDRAALAISERARARSLLDVLGSKGASRAGSAIPVELRERRQLVRRRVSFLADQQLQQRGEKAEASGRQIEALLAELDGVEAEIRRLDPLYASVAALPTFGVQEIAQLLDPGTLLLEYSLGENRSYLWAVGSVSFHSFVLPPQTEIETLARQLYDELSTYEAGAGRRSTTEESLSGILLGPVWSEVERGRRLVIVPDAALHVLPFGALPAPGTGRRLVEQLEIAYLPSATTLALQRQRLENRSPAAKWAAVLADPVFTPDDPRLTSPPPDGAAQPAAAPHETSRQEGPERSAPEEAPLAALERLPASRREAEAVVALAPEGQVWTALDLAASREKVLSGNLRDARVVHFATHGLADMRNPELSGLALSLVDAAGKPQEGFLSVSDIYDLDLQADLVVLSGCRTALGKEVRGEGIMGLTRGFLHAGVPRVVASLWKVQDRTTAELMTRFYRALWQDRLPPAAALRKAQLSLRDHSRYRDPYSWAGFVLQGDWR